MAKDFQQARSFETELEALGLMVSALHALDMCGASGVIGAHLDLAIARLREDIGLPPVLPDEWAAEMGSSRFEFYGVAS